MTTKDVPDPLARQVTEQIQVLGDLVREASTISDHDIADQERWALGLLRTLSDVDSRSRRLVHLLTAYALRSRLASPTTVAKTTGITITAAQNRAGSALAQEVWEEVWPPGANS